MNKEELRFTSTCTLDLGKKANFEYILEIKYDVNLVTHDKHVCECSVDIQDIKLHGLHYEPSFKLLPLIERTTRTDAIDKYYSGNL